MTDLPPPPVPAGLDLRDFGFMPLDVLRLRDSDLATLATGDEFKAAVLLWCAAWHQVPAGSLPKDDRWLARHSGAGPKWKKVRDEALRGFVEYSDGRLYHAVVVEKALEAWKKKGDQRLKTLKARIAAAEKRLSQASMDDDKDHLNRLIADLRQQLSQALESAATESVTDPVTATKGQGQGQGQGQGDSREDGVGTPRPPSPAKPSPPPEDDDLEPPLQLDRSDEATAVRIWNEATERTEWPSVQRLTDPRRRALKARLKDCGGLDGWRGAIERAEASSFLTGKTGRSGEHANWRCDFDFILRQAKFTKLMEGGFDDPPGSARPQQSNHARSREALAEWSREGDR